MSDLQITVRTAIDAPIEKVWDYYTNPEHIVKWNAANEDWHTPVATNNVTTGGKFNYRMEAKDGSAGFDFSGTYDEVRDYELISYSLEDARKVETLFSDNNGTIEVIQSFDAEGTQTDELQRQGWQAILDNFKRYTETH